MLNRAQQEAVRVYGHALITACPGSGKTTVLKHRAAHMLQTFPGSVLGGVTFTSESAAELDSRIRSEVPNAGERVICGTFHSLCKRQLTRAGRRFVLISDSQRMELLRRSFIDTGCGSACEFEDAVQFVDGIKSVVEPLKPPSSSEPRILVYERYQQLLQQMGALDFSDLIIEAVRGMESGDVGPVTGASGAVTHLLVDEFQDTDPVQLAWVREHVRQGVQVTVVGDDDQSIYGWRHAMGYEGMNAFRRETDATHIALNLTYRCSREIIAPAARLITHNTDRVQKILETANLSQGAVKVARFNSSEEEVEGLLRAIILSGARGDWGVLARTNAQLDAVERMMVAESIAYVRTGGGSFWDMRGPSLFLGVCQSLGAGDMIGLDELLRKCGVSEHLLERIHRSCKSRQPGALERFLVSKDGDANVGRIRKLAGEWRSMLQKNETRLAMVGIAHFIQHNAKLYEKTPPPAVVERDARMLKQCVQTLSRLSGPIASRLVALRQGEKKGSPDAQDVVRLMTLHSSKGLEFNRVWMLGCESGTIPSRKSPIEEERRLFYVGMTRAKTELTLSYVLSKLTPRSEFIDECGLK